MLVVIASCSDAPATPASDAPSGSEPTGIVDELPSAAREAVGTAEPRVGASWIEWSTCAPDNRADEAAANGGRTAGWVLVDDLLADPGIALGDHVVASCDEATRLLDGAGGTATPTSALAGHLLAAQLNLNIGAETCPAAEEAVIAGQVMLTSSGYDGSADRTESLPVADDGAMERVIEYLGAYNAGLLCQ